MDNGGMSKRDDYDFTMDHARRDRKELDKLISKTTSISMRCSVCNELLVFEDKSIKSLAEDGWRHQIWHVSPCENCIENTIAEHTHHE